MTTAQSQSADRTPNGDVGPPLRIGAVSYLNTLPLIEGLGKLEGVRLTLTAPARLIDLLLADEVDLALVSTIDYQRSAEELAMVPVGMIGCDGPTMTVRLFSRHPLAEIETIHADVDSHTSTTLARILVAGESGRVPSIEPYDSDAHRAERDSALGGAMTTPWPDTVLLIGDKVVSESPPAIHYAHQFDLGEVWKQRTGLPFVYATWMCRADRADEPGIRVAGDALDRQRRHNAMRCDWIAARHAPVRGWPIDVARSYLQDLLRFDVTERDRAAVDAFFDQAARLDLIPHRRPTRWVDV